MSRAGAGALSGWIWPSERDRRGVRELRALGTGAGAASTDAVPPDVQALAVLLRKS